MNLLRLLTFFMLMSFLLLFCISCDTSDRHTLIYERQVNPAFYGYVGDLSDDNRSRLDIIKQKNKLRAGIELDSEPFAYMESGELKGFEVDLLSYIAKTLEVDIEFIEINESTQYDYLLHRKIDIISSALEHKIERESFIDFSITYFMDGQRVLVKKSGRMDSLSDIIGKEIVVIKDKNYAKQIKYYAYNSNIVVFTDMPSSADSVMKENNIADCITGKGADLLRLKAMSDESSEYVFIDDYISHMPYAFGLPESDSKWRDAVNIALIKCYKEKEYREIFESYFGEGKQYEYPTEWKMEIWE